MHETMNGSESEWPRKLAEVSTSARSNSGSALWTNSSCSSPVLFSRNPTSRFNVMSTCCFLRETVLREAGSFGIVGVLQVAWRFKKHNHFTSENQSARVTEAAGGRWG